MEKYEIEKLRSLPIEAVAQRLGLKVQRHRAVCCFHDDHNPSLYFNVRKNTYRCFSCGAHGDVIGLAMHLLPHGGGREGAGGAFPSACKWLADENNIILTEYKPRTERAIKTQPEVDVRHLARLVAQPYLNDEARRFLFDERRIHPAVVRWLGLSSISSPMPMTASLRGGWFNAPSLLIPYRTLDGQLTSVQARYLGTTDQGADGGARRPSRFQFPQGAQCHIFNLPILPMLRDGEDLQICEGTSDCMAALSSGVKAVAIPSATLLSHNDMRLLASSVPETSRLIIYPDQDDAGEHLYTELLHVANDIGRCLVRRDLPAGCKDFADYWRAKNG